MDFFFLFLGGDKGKKLFIYMPFGNFFFQEMGFTLTLLNKRQAVSLIFY